MRILEDKKLDYSSVLIRPKRSTLGSRKEVELARQFSYRNANLAESIHYDGIPIMAANMDGVGTFAMADALAEHKLFCCLKKSYSEDQLIEFFSQNNLKRSNNVAYSMGITRTDFDKFKKVYANKTVAIKYVCVDVANGYSERFAAFIKRLRESYPKIVIIAGNVVTGEMTEELILSGADIVKVGIGPGSVCTTRIQTGVGFPQLSAVMECADAAHGLGGHIIADGGCTSPGDVAKAFAGGADFVMLGGMLAGHTEGGGEVVSKYYKTGEVAKINGEWQDLIEEEKTVEFYGMSSQKANIKHFGGLKKYRSSEGREVEIPYRESLDHTVLNLLGGIRSTCTYAGAKKLKYLSKCTTFVKTDHQFNAVFINNS